MTKNDQKVTKNAQKASQNVKKSQTASPTGARRLRAARRPGVVWPRSARRAFGNRQGNGLGALPSFFSSFTNSTNEVRFREKVTVGGCAHRHTYS